MQEDGKLVAVIVPKLSEVHVGKEEAVCQAIREAVQTVSERLPSYQRISDFVLTRDSLARTRLGKIRRHLLAERFEQEKARLAGGLGEIRNPHLVAQPDAAAQTLKLTPSSALFCSRPAVSISSTSVLEARAFSRAS